MTDTTNTSLANLIQQVTLHLNNGLFRRNQNHYSLKMKYWGFNYHYGTLLYLSIKSLAIPILEWLLFFEPIL